MYKLQKTEIFDSWLMNLRDMNVKGKILARLKRAELGNLGDFKALGSRLHEMRVDYRARLSALFHERKGKHNNFTFRRFEINSGK